MINATRNYKDNVFCMLYRDKENLLSLYNAVNGTNYQNAEELEVVTLDFAICVSMRNDVAFVIDTSLNLYEQQSTPNPNMPLRDLYYIAEELKKLVPMRGLYRSKAVKIPVPRFVTFYNGAQRQPKEVTLRLSDLYETSVEKPELELTVRQININRCCNGDILEKCTSLRGYMAFVDKIRDKAGSGIRAQNAVAEAVDECISEGILCEFFTKYRNEVIEMGIYDYNAEEHDEVIWEEGKAEGKAEGRAEGKAEGRVEGKAEAIIELLEELGTVPLKLKNTIMEQQDLDMLSKWHKLSAKSDTIEEFMERI